MKMANRQSEREHPCQVSGCPVKPGGNPLLVTPATVKRENLEASQSKTARKLIETCPPAAHHSTQSSKRHKDWVRSFVKGLWSGVKHTGVFQGLGSAPNYQNLKSVTASGTPSCPYVIVTGSITTWYGSCTAIERKALQRVVRTAQYITGVPLPNLLDLYTSRCLRKTRKILKDSTHPSHCLFPQLPSGRRFRSIKSRTSRLRDLPPSHQATEQPVVLMHRKPTAWTRNLETEEQSWTCNLRAQSQTRNLRAQSQTRNRETQGQTRDRETRGQTRNRETRGQTGNRETQGQTRNRETQGQTRDRETQGQTRDRETQGQTRDRETQGQTRDLETQGQTRDLETQGQTRDLETQGQSWTQNLKAQGQSWTQNLKAQGQSLTQNLKAQGQSWTQSLKAQGQSWTQSLKTQGQSWTQNLML
ncbi:hypothetical protein NFI96_004022 [Prochilodus magdalenae]|nr:hypothetical protein NFI96_004022 [Prochilodus magdalenae]